MVTGIGSLDALNAYGRLTGGTGGASRATALTEGGSDGGAGEGDFGAMMSKVVGDTADTLGKAEQASLKQIAGKGDLIDVVTAIGAAETALDTMVAVRDRVVSAYGEIMRMQI